jgi:glycosyltransferase involved in cell wall biosynthesis
MSAAARIGWLVNDQVAPLPGQRTVFSELLDTVPGLKDMTGGYTDYRVLREVIDAAYRSAVEDGTPPEYIVRNATYFLPLQCSSTAPTVSYLQDIKTGVARKMQLETMRLSRHVVYNSAYTAQQYWDAPADVPYSVIPVGVDFSQFTIATREERFAWQAEYGIEPGSVCWVGSGHTVKGLSVLRRIIEEIPAPFCVVLKDTSEFAAPRTQVFRQLSPSAMRKVMGSCAIGLCTSVQETQHLAGIEMAACGVPIVTTPVGVYYDREEDVWGAAVEPYELADTLRRWLATLGDTESSRQRVRAYWEAAGVSTHGTRALWHELLKGVR